MSGPAGSPGSRHGRRTTTQGPATARRRRGASARAWSSPRTVTPRGCRCPWACAGGRTGRSPWRSGSPASSGPGEDPVRGQPREWLAELEVVGEFGAVALLALADPGDQRAAGGHRLAQLAEQVRVLAEPLDQDGAGAVEGGGGVRDSPARVDEVRGL